MRNIYYKIEGGGYPLIFLHGFCETHFVWKDLANELKHKFKVVLIDLPGFGKSPILDDGFTIDEVAQSIKELIDELKISNGLMIGHSLGGYVAMSFLRQFPEALDGYCLYNSTVFEDTADKKENRNKLIELINKSGTAGFIQTFIPSLFFEKRVREFESLIEELRAMGKNIDPLAVTGYAAAMRDRSDEMETLKNHFYKVMIIAGMEDKNVPEEASRKMKDIIKSENFYLFEATAHMAMFENTGKSIEAITAFAESCQAS